MPSNYVLGFDFGLKYIGVAVGQFVTKTASPHSSIKAVNGIPNAGQLKELLDKWQPKTCVVGIPYNMDGTEQPMTFKARKFGNRLKNDYKVNVEFADERLTSWEVKNNPDNKNHDFNKINSEAAVVILEQWFNDN